MINIRSKALLCSSLLLVSLCASVSSSRSIHASADSGTLEETIVAVVEESTFIEPVPAYEEVVIEEYIDTTETTLISLGEFKITVYDACEYCSSEWGTQLARPCSDGHSAIENHTVAVDPEVIPYGTRLLIDGIEYVAEDCGGAVKGNVIDVYVEDCENSFGRKFSEVFIIEE